MGDWEGNSEEYRGGRGEGTGIFHFRGGEIAGEV